MQLVNSLGGTYTKTSVYGLTLLYCIIALFGIWHHELWLDEAHHWLLARDSNSFQELIKNTRYEGHPILWNVLLYGITRVSTNPIWMQLLHVSIAVAAVFVFLKRAPFSALFKLLFVFGYFLLFEYVLISRNYNLGLLFTFLACSYFKYRTEKFVIISIFLAIACNTHAIFLVLSACTMVQLFWERLQDESLRFSKKTWIGLGIFSFGALAAILQILPPEDIAFFDKAATTSFLEKIPKAIFPFFKGVFILQDMRLTSFWNTNLLLILSKPIAVILGVLSLLTPYFLFYKSKTLLCYSYFTIFCMGIFFFITQLSANRYYGVLYLMLIVGLWLQVYIKESELSINISRNILKKIRPTLLYTILTLQCIAGVFAYTKDVVTPFTTAKLAFEYLQEKGLENKIIASQSCGGMPLSSYLESQVYFTKLDKFESFCPWNNPLLKGEQPKEAVILSLEQLLIAKTESIIFVSHQPIFNLQKQGKWESLSSTINCKFLQKFEESIVNKGTCYLYEISKK